MTDKPTRSGDGIVARGVMKSFDGNVVLSPTDLDAPNGELSLLIGRNGAGKSTMLRILGTLVIADAGSITINGLDPDRDDRLVRRQIGLALVNERSVFWRLSVLENVELWSRLRGIPRSRRRAACEAVLEELGLGAFGRRDAFALSAGQRQRLVLARTMVGEPPVLLIDEPLRGLDPDAEKLVIDALVKRAEAGAAVLVATPSASEFEAFPKTRINRVGTGSEVVES